MAQIGITQKETSTASQPAKVASQTKHQTQPASQPTSQPKKTNQPGNQIQILSEKVVPKTWCLGGNDPNWYYSQRDWTLPCPRILESNSKNKCFGKEWPKLALLRRRHLQPARQDSQPNTRPNTSTARLVRKNNARAKNFLFGIASKARELYLFLKSNSNKECFEKKSLNWNYFQVAHESHS